MKQSETGSTLLRGAGNWYEHGGDSGYMHLNQIMGAGEGMDQTCGLFELSIKKISPWGFQFNCEKIQRGTLNNLAKCTDLIWVAESSFSNHYLNIKLSMNYFSSRNYTWVEGKNNFTIIVA